MPTVMLEPQAAGGQRLVCIVSLDHNAKPYAASSLGGAGWAISGYADQRTFSQ
jgi:hypothetical protein